MKSGRSVLAVTGTVLMLSLAVALHAVGQFGGESDTASALPAPSLPAEAIALESKNFDDLAPTGKEADVI